MQELKDTLSAANEMHESVYQKVICKRSSFRNLLQKIVALKNSHKLHR